MSLSNIYYGCTNKVLLLILMNVILSTYTTLSEGGRYLIEHSTVEIPLFDLISFNHLLAIPCSDNKSNCRWRINNTWTPNGSITNKIHKNTNYK